MHEEKEEHGKGLTSAPRTCHAVRTCQLADVSEDGDGLHVRPLVDEQHRQLAQGELAL